MNQKALLKDDVMGFLNEVQIKMPQALPLVSGRPDEDLFHFDKCLEYVKDYSRRFGDSQQIDSSLLQYNKTKGIINDLVKNYLEKDERIKTSSENIVMTVGAQEAMLIALVAFCNPEIDAIAVENPSYIGMSDLAQILGYDVVPISLDEDGIILDELESKLTQKGKRIKLVYVIPDFQNPTGKQMSLQRRKDLIALANKCDFYLLEDNAYGQFIYEGSKLPTLKSLDSSGKVIYVGSFSKIIFPTIRLAAMVVGSSNGNGDDMVDRIISSCKAYFTVNTSSFSQLLLASILEKHNCSLQQFSEDKVEVYRKKRDECVRSLNYYLKDYPITIFTPRGGFFLYIEVPFEVGKEETYLCAKDFGVIFCPMSFFYFNVDKHKQIRLAFSGLKFEKIDPAIKRLSQFIKSKIES